MAILVAVVSDPRSEHFLETRERARSDHLGAQRVGLQLAQIGLHSDSQSWSHRYGIDDTHSQVAAGTSTASEGIAGLDLRAAYRLLDVELDRRHGGSRYEVVWVDAAQKTVRLERRQTEQIGKHKRWAAGGARQRTTPTAPVSELLDRGCLCARFAGRRRPTPAVAPANCHFVTSRRLLPLTFHQDSPWKLARSSSTIFRGSLSLHTAASRGQPFLASALSQRRGKASTSQLCYGRLHFSAACRRRIQGNFLVCESSARTGKMHHAGCTTCTICSSPLKVCPSA